MLWYTCTGSTVRDKVCHLLVTGQWFSPGTPISSINKTDHHDIAEVLLKVALNFITVTLHRNARQGRKLHNNLKMYFV